VTFTAISSDLELGIDQAIHYGYHIISSDDISTDFFFKSWLSNLSYKGSAMLKKIPNKQNRL